jgi:beta-glucosidase
MTVFPDDFLWGAATAGHQVEGGNVNADLWPLEWTDSSSFTDQSGDACDHYHRYREDIKILADVGLNAYRFSLEWARIEPERGFFSQAALDHYRRVIETCHELNVTPVVTLNHFTVPRWVAGIGAWASAETPKLFAAYARRIAEELGELMPWVCTLNEPNLISMLEHTGILPLGTGSNGPPPTAAEAISAGVGGYDPALYRIGLMTGSCKRMAEAHRFACDAFKDASPRSKVGWTLALVDIQSVPGGEERADAARRGGQLDWLDVSRQDDFVGVQSYSRSLIDRDGTTSVPEGAATMQTGWETYPEALGHVVRLAAEHSGVPVLVTENGMATDDDQLRIEYTSAALKGLAECIADGVDVRGYLHWTLLDNFEWMSGYQMTFGLIAVDLATFQRTIKPSARWLGGVARSNGLEI